MNTEKAAARDNFIKVLKDQIYNSYGIDVEVSMNDTLYRSLLFIVKPEDREVMYRQITDKNFVEFVRPVGTEVIELDNGQGVDRLVVQMREGIILDRINFANELQDIANHLDLPYQIFCEGKEFSLLRILAPSSEMADGVSILAPIQKLKERLAALDFEGCKIQDPESTRQLIIKGKPLINF